MTGPTPQPNNRQNQGTGMPPVQIPSEPPFSQGAKLSSIDTSTCTQRVSSIIQGRLSPESAYDEYVNNQKRTLGASIENIVTNRPSITYDELIDAIKAQVGAELKKGSINEITTLRANAQLSSSEMQQFIQKVFAPATQANVLGSIMSFVDTPATKQWLSDFQAQSKLSAQQNSLIVPKYSVPSFNVSSLGDSAIRGFGAAYLAVNSLGYLAAKFNFLGIGAQLNPYQTVAYAGASLGLLFSALMVFNPNRQPSLLNSIGRSLMVGCGAIGLHQLISYKSLVPFAFSYINPGLSLMLGAAATGGYLFIKASKEVMNFIKNKKSQKANSSSNP